MGFEWLLDMACKNVVQPDAQIVPAAASVFCVGVEVLSNSIAGYDMRPLNKFRYERLETCWLLL